MNQFTISRSICPTKFIVKNFYFFAILIYPFLNANVIFNIGSEIANILSPMRNEVLIIKQIGFKKISLRFIFLFIITLSSFLYSQKLSGKNSDIKFEHLTVEDGLSQSYVRCLFQDSKGFLWIGTEDGLNRYDGYNFKIYRHSLSDTTSISCSYILSIFEDKRGNLWIGTNGGGLNLFVPETETFIRFEADKNKPDWLGNRVVNAMVEDSSGYLWLAVGWLTDDCKSGLYRLDPLKRKFKRYVSEHHEVGEVFLTILQPPDQRFLWLGGAEGLLLFDKVKEKFIYRSSEQTTGSEIAGDTRHIVMDEEGKIWLATLDGIKRKIFNCFRYLL